MRKCLAPFAGNGIHKVGNRAGKDQFTTDFREGLQALHCRAAEGLTVGNQDDIIFHLANLQRRSALCTLLRQQTLTDIVKVNATQKQPVGHILEIAVQGLPGHGCLLSRSPVEPIALHRMDYANLYNRLAPGHGRCQTGKMILHIIILLPPGRLVTNGSRIVTLGSTFHGYPGQVGHPDSHAQSSLPVAMELMAPEVEVPVGHAVKLTHQSLITKLVDSRLCLLCGGVFKTGAEHINTRQVEAAVSTHSFTQCSGLATKGGFLHHMTGQRNAMLPAPCAAVIRKGFREPLTDMVMVMVTANRRNTVRFVPDQFRHRLHKVLARICRGVSIRQIIGPRQRNVGFFQTKSQGGLAGKLGFIGKDRRDGLVKFFRNSSVIGFVGNLNEPVHSLFVQSVHIGLVIVPTAGSGILQVSIPGIRCGFFGFFQSAAADEISALIELYIVSCQEFSVFRSAHGCCGNFHVGSRTIIGRGGKEQVPCPVLRILCNKAACRAGGPTVLIIQPCQHIFGFCFIHAGLDQIHVFFT